MKLSLKFALILSSILAVASGCATMEPGAVRSENAPKDYNKNRKSFVTYNSQGLDELVTMRRNDAFGKMKDFCGSSEYEIIEEKPVEEPAKYSSVGNMFASEVTKIEFKCK